MSGGVSVNVSYGAPGAVPAAPRSPLPSPPAEAPAITGASASTLRAVMARGDSNGDERVNYREFDAAMRQRESAKALRSGPFASTIGLYASIQLQQFDAEAAALSVRA